MASHNSSHKINNLTNGKDGHNQNHNSNGSSNGNGAASTKTVVKSSGNDEPSADGGNWYAKKFSSGYHLAYAHLLLTVRLTPLKEMIRNRKYDASDELRIPGEVAVITGGPRGIAYELVKKLLQLDFFVIMGARDVPSSQSKIDKIRSEGITKGKVHLLHLNLKSLSGTRKFVENVSDVTNRVDYLFNNAGIMMTPFETTEDGFESQFQVNYLSHFLITKMLLPTIKNTSEMRKREGAPGGCRIVNTTSVYHLAGSIDFDKVASNYLNNEVYASTKAYFDAKLCQAIFTREMEKRFQAEGANVQCYCVHPGIIPESDLWDAAGGYHSIISYVLKPVMPTIEDGANALLHAALSSKLEGKGGSYLEGLVIAEPHKEAQNPEIQERLWKYSEKLVAENHNN